MTNPTTIPTKPKAANGSKITTISIFIFLFIIIAMCYRGWFWINPFNNYSLSNGVELRFCKFSEKWTPVNSVVSPLDALHHVKNTYPSRWISNKDFYIASGDCYIFNANLNGNSMSLLDAISYNAITRELKVLDNAEIFPIPITYIKAGYVKLSGDDNQRKIKTPTTN